MVTRDDFVGCTRCDGHGYVTKNYQPYYQSAHDGRPWTNTVEQSDDNKRGFLKRVICPFCGGNGLIRK